MLSNKFYNVITKIEPKAFGLIVIIIPALHGGGTSL